MLILSNVFYTAEEDEWGGITYNPTFLGKLVLAVLVIALLLAAVAIVKHTINKKAKESEQKASMKLTATQLAVCALAIALGTVLSEIKVFEFPTGGAITLLSMFVICLPGYFFGMSAGILTGVAYGFLQLILGPYVVHPIQLLCDYPLAFGALGLSGMFHKSKNGILPGYIVAITGRFIFHVISGWIYFGEWAWEGWNPLAYSMAYNAIYIYAEGAITVAILCIPQVRKAFRILKRNVFMHEENL